MSRVDYVCSKIIFLSLFQSKSWDKKRTTTLNQRKSMGYKFFSKNVEDFVVERFVLKAKILVIMCIHWT